MSKWDTPPPPNLKKIRSNNLICTKNPNAENQYIYIPIRIEISAVVDTELHKLQWWTQESLVFGGRMAEEVRIQIGNVSLKRDIVVCDISDDLLLGLDFLEDHDTVIDLKWYIVSIDNQEVPIKQIKDMEFKEVNIYKVSIQKRTTIPPNTMKFVKLKTNSSCREILAIQPLSIHNELLCPNSVISPNNPYTTIRNVSNRYILQSRKMLR